MSDKALRAELKNRLKSLYLTGAGSAAGAAKSRAKKAAKRDARLTKEYYEEEKKYAQEIEDDPLEFTDNPLLGLKLTQKEKKMLSAPKKRGRPRKINAPKVPQRPSKAKIAELKAMTAPKIPPRPKKKRGVAKGTINPSLKFYNDCLRKFRAKHPDVPYREAQQIVKKNIDLKRRRCNTNKYKGGVLNDYGGVLADYGGVLADSPNY